VGWDGRGILTFVLFRRSVERIQRCKGSISVLCAPLMLVNATAARAVCNWYTYNNFKLYSSSTLATWPIDPHSLDTCHSTHWRLLLNIQAVRILARRARVHRFQTTGAIYTIRRS
jgi:hypothetical protein